MYVRQNIASCVFCSTHPLLPQKTLALAGGAIWLRTPKSAPAFHRETVNLDAAQHARFLTLYEQSGLSSKSKFIAARIFGDSFRVIRIFGDSFRVIRTDRGTMEYVARLTALYQQYRAVGVNYNQTVKELHVHFTEKKALALLYKLEKLTLELVALSRRIVGLSEELKRYGGENQHG